MIKGTYQLIEPITNVQQINVAQRINGRITHGVLRLTPGKVYELEDDELFLKSLQAATVQKRYDTNLEAQLKAAGVEYQQNFCKSCGGRVKKLEYSIVKVVEE
ncbi:hypothetical protein [Enterococcus sp. DIV0800]|uniref:hypothetical protein n=1 Tax=unclassified Enterococcus TaxID=2608891 RepID=UPI003D2FD083